MCRSYDQQISELWKKIHDIQMNESISHREAEKQIDELKQQQTELIIQHLNLDEDQANDVRRYGY